MVTEDLEKVKQEVVGLNCALKDAQDNLQTANLQSMADVADATVDLKQQLEAAKQRQTDLKKLLDASETENTSLKSEYHKLAYDMAVAENSTKNLAEKCSCMANGLANADATHKQQETQITTLSKTIQQLESEKREWQIQAEENKTLKDKLRHLEEEKKKWREDRVQEAQILNLMQEVEKYKADCVQ